MFVNEKESKILDKLGFTSDIWFKAVSLYSNSHYSCIGTDNQFKAICEDKEQKWLAGSRSCREIYA